MRSWSAPARFLAWTRRVSAWRPDLALDVQGLLRSLILARACRPRHLIGYSDAREGAVLGFDVRIDAARSRSPHAVDRYLTLADAFGWPLPPPAAVEFPLPPGREPGPEVKQRLPDSFLVFHPFSRGAGKSLEPAQVERFCAEVTGLPVVLVGRAAPEQANLRLPPSAVNLLNATSLPELVWILRRASGTVSVDSGPMHLAAALSPRVLSLHTWSDPLKVGPYPDKAFAWWQGRTRSMAEWRAVGTGPPVRRGQGSFPDSGIADLVDYAATLTPSATSP
jgi:ADP-heptose:LPS heptosyltransferase